MSSPGFVHLHLHSEFSIHDSLIKIPKLITKTEQQGLPSVALTDLCNLFALVKFYSKAIKAGIKPIIGSEVWIKQDETQYKLVLLCKNNAGYQNLTAIISKAFQEAKREAIPIIPFEWLSEYKEGLIVLSGGVQGQIGQSIINGKLDEAIAVETKAKELATDNDREFIAKFLEELNAAKEKEKGVEALEDDK